MTFEFASTTVKPFQVVPISPKPLEFGSIYAFARLSPPDNPKEPTLGAFPKNLTLESLVNRNAPSSIRVTCAGIVIDFSEVILENVYRPIEVTLVGIVIDVMDLAPSKAFAPIEVTPEGISIDIKEVVP